MCLCAIMIHSLFVPHIMATVLHKAGSVMAKQPLSRSFGWHSGQSLCGAQDSESQHVLFLAMLHSLVETPVLCVIMIYNRLGLGHAAFVHKSWLHCCKSLLHTKLGSHHVFFASIAALTMWGTKL